MGVEEYGIKVSLKIKWGWMDERRCLEEGRWKYNWREMAVDRRNCQSCKSWGGVFKSFRRIVLRSCAILNWENIFKRISIQCYSICEQNAVRKITWDRHVRNGLHSWRRKLHPRDTFPHNCIWEIILIAMRRCSML